MVFDMAVVMIAIALDCETMLDACEVEDVRVERVLSSESASQLTSS